MAVAAFVQSVIVLQKHARTEGLRKRVFIAGVTQPQSYAIVHRDRAAVL
jgi:hypothetical protein